MPSHFSTIRVVEFGPPGQATIGACRKPEILLTLTLIWKKTEVLQRPTILLWQHSPTKCLDWVTTGCLGDINAKFRRVKVQFCSTKAKLSISEVEHNSKDYCPYYALLEEMCQIQTAFIPWLSMRKVEIPLLHVLCSAAKDV